MGFHAEKKDESANHVRLGASRRKHPVKRKIVIPVASDALADDSDIGERAQAATHTHSRRKNVILKI